jgi:hypothetical protein
VGETKSAYSILVAKPEGRRPFERPRRRWENNLRMGLGEEVWRNGGRDPHILKLRTRER